MQMTNEQRLLGIMLAEVMEAMGLNGEIDPSFVKRALINHDDWSIAWKYHGAFNAEEHLKNDDVQETANILSMMSYIEYSLSQLDATDRAALGDDYALKFRGFDGNNDPHHSIAHTLINELERFSEFAERPLNSHSSSTLQVYRRIKPIYDRVMPPSNGNGLSADQLREIVAASRY